MREIRRPRPDEYPAMNALVADVVREVYGVDDPQQMDWATGWAAFDGGLVAVGLADADYIDDLWVRHTHRGRGIGAKLLRHLEADIAGRGHAIARLRVVLANARAVRFYQRHGFVHVRTYPHERTGMPMLDMHKRL